MSRFSCASMAFAALFAVSCGGAESSSNGEAEEVSQVKSAASTCSLDQVSFSWSQNNFDTQMSSDSTHFCWLTKVAGRFDGDKGQDVGITVERGPTDGLAGGSWWLRTRASQEYAEARCAPLSCFSGDGSKDKRLISGTFNALATADGGCDHFSTPTWWGDGATVLQGFPGPGNTGGFGEYASIDQSADPFASSSVHANDCNRDGLGKWIRGYANSLFVGTPSGGVAARFQGPNPPNGGTIDVVGEYALSSSGTNLFRWKLMALAEYHICYLAKVGGEFNGGGEIAMIDIQNDSDGNPRWRLFVQHQSGAGVQAVARCYRYDQYGL
jgi:hypothetical protein